MFSNKIKSILSIVLLCSLVIACGRVENYNSYRKGVKLNKEGKYKEAIKIFTKVISNDEKLKGYGYSGRGYAYFKLHKYERALDDINSCLETEVINTNKLNASTYWTQARIFDALENDVEEYNAYIKALEYDPDDVPLKNTFALILIENDEVQRGINILTESIENGFNHSFAFNNRALGYIKNNQLEEALVDLQKAEKMDNENPFVYRNYYHYYRKKGDSVLACKYLQKALSLDILKYSLPKDKTAMEDLLKENCYENQ